MDAQVDTVSFGLEIMTSVFRPATRSCFESVSVDSSLYADNLTLDVSSGAGSTVVASGFGSGSAILLFDSVERFCCDFSECLLGAKMPMTMNLPRPWRLLLWCGSFSVTAERNGTQTVWKVVQEELEVRTVNLNGGGFQRIPNGIGSRR